MYVRALLCFLALTACGDWPDVDSPQIERRSSNWPQLLPLSDLIEMEAVRVADEPDAERLSERAALLRARAGILRSNAGDPDAMEALRARLR